MNTPSQQRAGKPWHSLDVDRIEAELDAGAEGLTSEQAEARLAQYGPNALPVQSGRSAWRRLLAQLHNLLIYVLLGAAVLTALMGHWIDTWVILAVVVLNTLIGYVQEGKAEKALDAIRHMLAPGAIVIRDGHRQHIDAQQLVPGDVLLLEPGDKVPADARIVFAKGLQIQEAVLTGESVAVEKRVDPVAVDADLGDRFCMTYSGTLVTAGHGRALVVETGANTQIGRISGMIGRIESLTTPLLQQIAVFSRWLTVAILGLAIVVFLFGYFVQQIPATDMFMIVVGLAVAAIPEGLPAILTITLAIGVQRMAGRNAIIRRLPAVETLGAVSIICSDKTGTLTRNEMTLASIVVAEHDYTLTGVGYAPQGDILAGEAVVDLAQHTVLADLLRSIVLCNDASLKRRDGDWVASGDPMEAAMLTAAMKADLVLEEQQQQFARKDVIPFDAEHRFMATLHHDHQGHGFIAVKGAPEKLVELCRFQAAATGSQPLDREHWLAHIERIAAEGQRVLAVATRPLNGAHDELKFSDLDQDLILLGLIGLIDPPREEAIEAVAECHSAGIRVKMITGDHAATAQAIASQLGLANTDRVLTGHDISQLDDEALKKLAPQIDVFARTSPEHKLRLVSALQANDLVVAMTGDGVNDAPALKRADVGIAMGRNGTEAAKEAAEMVLADDNFASISRAVREGRTVYDNLKKAILFLLPVNGGESLSIIAAVLVGLTLPITPLQILWVNMVSSVALALSLAFEPSEPETMRRRPRPRDEKMLSGFLIWRISFVSTLFLIGIYGMFQWTLSQGASVDTARTYAVNTLVVMEVFYLFNVRYLGGGSWNVKQWFTSKAVFISVGLVVAFQLLFTYHPLMNTLFHTTPIGLWHGMEIIAVGIMLFMVLEIEKWLRRRLTQG